ncbi:hypothetical protein DIPPA_00107 [Diplonema papillatum]|nr:hypothetical protein DIPPA_00107 [Diplonema papillatum]
MWRFPTVLQARFMSAFPHGAPHTMGLNPVQHMKPLAEKRRLKEWKEDTQDSNTYNEWLDSRKVEISKAGPNPELRWKAFLLERTLDEKVKLELRMICLQHFISVQGKGTLTLLPESTFFKDASVQAAMRQYVDWVHGGAATDGFAAALIFARISQFYESPANSVNSAKTAGLAYTFAKTAFTANDDPEKEHLFRLSLARLNLKLLRWDDAIVQCDLVLTQHAANPAAALYKAAALIGLRRFEEAQKLLSECPADAPSAEYKRALEAQCAAGFEEVKLVWDGGFNDRRLLVDQKDLFSRAFESPMLSKYHHDQVFLMVLEAFAELHEEQNCTVVLSPGAFITAESVGENIIPGIELLSEEPWTSLDDESTPRYDVVVSGSRYVRGTAAAAKLPSVPSAEFIDRLLPTIHFPESSGLPHAHMQTIDMLGKLPPHAKSPMNAETKAAKEARLRHRFERKMFIKRRLTMPGSPEDDEEAPGSGR